MVQSEEVRESSDVSFLFFVHTLAASVVEVLRTTLPRLAAWAAKTFVIAFLPPCIFVAQRLNSARPISGCCISCREERGGRSGFCFPDIHQSDSPVFACWPSCPGSSWH